MTNFCGIVNSFTSKKQTTEFSSANFQKVLSPNYMYIILRIHRLEANSVDLDEVAHHEPPHQDLCCLHIQIFSSLVNASTVNFCRISWFTSFSVIVHRLLGHCLLLI